MNMHKIIMAILVVAGLSGIYFMHHKRSEQQIDNVKIQSSGAANGSACTSGSQCTSKNCMNGTCQPCGGTGAQCTGNSNCCSQTCSNGICVVAANGSHCTSSNQCSSNNCDNGICNEGASATQPCTENYDCESGYCNSGYCGGPSMINKPISIIVGGTLVWVGTTATRTATAIGGQMLLGVGTATNTK